MPWLALAASTALPLLLPPATAGFTAQTGNPGNRWTAAVLAPPTNLTATPVCTTSGTATAKLTWQPTTSAWATGYQLTGSDGVAMSVSISQAAQPDNTPLTNGTSYTWRLVTTGAGWTSTAATVALTPNCPPGTVSGSMVQAQSPKSGTYTVTPAGVAVGDLMVVQIVLSTTNNNFTSGAPAGWTSAGAPVLGSGMSSFVYYRVATAADTGPAPASYTWTASGGGTGNGAAALVAFRGVDPATPLDGPPQSASGTASSTGTPTATAPGVPTTHANDTLVALFGAFTAQVTGAGTMTQSYSFPPTALAGPALGLAAYTETIPTATANTGTRTATLSTGKVAWTAWTLALAP